MKRPIFGINFQRRFGICLSFNEMHSIDVNSPKIDCVNESHDLTEVQLSELNAVIKELPTVTESGPLNCTTEIEHTIETGNHKPIIYIKNHIFSRSNYKRRSDKRFSDSLNVVLSKKFPPALGLTPLLLFQNQTEQSDYALMHAN